MIEKVIGNGEEKKQDEVKSSVTSSISRNDSTNTDDAIVEDIDPVETMLKEAAEDEAD